MRLTLSTRGRMLLFFTLAAPALLKAEPIAYQVLFPGSGTFTDSSSGQQTSFNTNVVITIYNQTQYVQSQPDTDGGPPIGWMTDAPICFVSIPGVVEAAGAPVRILAPGAGDDIEFFQTPDTFVATTFDISTPAGLYDLTSNTALAATIVINYFNQGVWKTTKGMIGFNPATVTGYFTGTLIPATAQ